MIRDCVYLLGLTVLLGTGVLCLLSAPVAAEGGIDAGHIEVDAPELDGGGYYSSVEVTFGENADFGGQENRTAVRFELEENDNALIREIKPGELEHILMDDRGYLLFEEDRSGESVRFQILLELESELRYNTYDSFSLVTTVADEAKDDTIEDSFDDFIDGFVHDESVDNETAVNLTINPGPPTDIDIDLPSSTGDYTPEPVNLEFEDKYGNEFQSHPTTITLTSEHHQVSEDLAPPEDAWPPTIGINGTIDPIIGNTTVKATANNHSASTDLRIHPENPTLQPVYPDFDADGDCELPVEFHLTKPEIAVEPVMVEFEHETGPGNIRIRDQAQESKLILGDDSTALFNVTDPVSTYLITAETPGEYTLTAAAVPAVEEVPTATASATAHGQIQSGNITIDDNMLGTAVGNDLQLTVNDLATDHGAIEHTQRSITGLVVDDQTVPVEPVTPEQGTFNGTVEIEAENLTPGAAERIGIKFDEGAGGSISATTTVEVVHERTRLPASGWHRLSVPVRPTTVTYDGIQTDRNDDPVEIGWCPSDQQYERVKQWEPADRVHRGWYVYARSEATVGVTYNEEHSEKQNRSLRSGWNLLGTHFDVSMNASTSIDAELSNITNATVGDRPDDTTLTGWDTYWVYTDHQQHRQITPVSYDPADRSTQNTTSTVEMKNPDREYPGDPARYTGTVSIDGTPVSEGSTVTVTSDNGDQTITAESAGQFSLVVEQGNEVTFTTDETESATRMAYKDTGTFEINLESTSSTPSPTPAPSPSPSPDPKPPEPTAVPDVPETVTAGTNVTLCGGDSDGEIASFSWTIGDTSREGQTVTTAFETPGSHEVTLVVTDTHDRSDQATTAIEVNEAAGVEVDQEQSPEESTLLTGIQLYALIGATLLLISAGLVRMTQVRA